MFYSCCRLVCRFVDVHCLLVIITRCFPFLRLHRVGNSLISMFCVVLSHGRSSLEIVS